MPRWSAQWADKLVAEIAPRSRCSATSRPKRRRAACGRSSTSTAQRAGQLGVSLQGVTDTLNDAFAQRQISTIYGQANQYRVVLEALPMYQRDPSILSKLYLPGAAAPSPARPTPQVPLSAVATPDAHHGAAGDLAPGAISGGLAQLQPRAGRRARRRG